MYLYANLNHRIVYQTNIFNSFLFSIKTVYTFIGKYLFIFAIFKTKHKHDNSLLLNKSNANREALKPSHNFVYIPQKELTFSFSVFVTNETFQEVWHKQNRANFLNIREKSTFFDKNSRQTFSSLQIEKCLLLIIIHFY